MFLHTFTGVSQTNVKAVQKCSNMKDKLLCMLRQHRRRQLIERLERFHDGCNDILEDQVDPEESGDAARKSTSRQDDRDEGFACDLGIRYPVFRAAVDRDLLHMREKVRIYYTYLHIRCTAYTRLHM